MKNAKHFAWVAIIAIITIALFACKQPNDPPKKPSGTLSIIDANENLMVGGTLVPALENLQNILKGDDVKYTFVRKSKGQGDEDVEEGLDNDKDDEGNDLGRYTVTFADVDKDIAVTATYNGDTVAFETVGKVPTPTFTVQLTGKGLKNNKVQQVADTLFNMTVESIKNVKNPKDAIFTYSWAIKDVDGSITPIKDENGQMETGQMVEMKNGYYNKTISGAATLKGVTVGNKCITATDPITKTSSIEATMEKTYTVDVDTGVIGIKEVTVLDERKGVLTESLVDCNFMKSVNGVFANRSGNIYKDIMTRGLTVSAENPVEGEEGYYSGRYKAHSLTKVGFDVNKLPRTTQGTADEILLDMDALRAESEKPNPFAKLNINGLLTKLAAAKQRLMNVALRPRSTNERKPA